MTNCYTNANIIVCNDAFDVYENGILVEENGKIIYCGEKNDSVMQKCDNIIDYSGCWILPGLINTHTHSHMTILRGFKDDVDLSVWLNEYIWPAESKFNHDITTTSTELAIIEMLKSGTTTFNDMYNPIGLDIDKIHNSCKKSKIRCFFSPTLFSSKDENVEETISKTKETLKKIISYKDENFKTMVAPHAPYSCSKELLEKSLELAKELNLMIHIHVSETDKEIETIMEKHNCRPIEYLERLGYLNHKSVFAHGVILNDEEIQKLKKSKVGIAHNPLSNLKLASGIARINELIDNDVLVSVATDSVASNNNLDLFEELRTATVLQKGRLKDAKVITVEQALKTITINAAKMLDMEEKIGSLEKGKFADFIVIDPKEKAHLQPVNKFLSHIVYSVKSSDVKDVFISGQQVVKNGKVLTLNEKTTYKKINDLFETLNQQL